MNSVDELLLKCIKNREELAEPKIFLRPLLRGMGTEGYIKLCSRRIAEADLIDGKNIDFDLNDPYNIIFTGDGILIASDILLGYCDEKKLRDVLGLLLQTRRLYRNINDQAMFLKTMETQTLRDMKKGRDTSDLPEDTKQRVINMASAELKARRIYNIVFRKISYGIYWLKTYLKYRCLLKFMSQLQDVEKA